MSDVQNLLVTARALELKVVGISFHVGSGATNPAAFSTAIALARQVSTPGTSYARPLHCVCGWQLRLMLHPARGTTALDN